MSQTLLVGPGDRHSHSLDQHAHWWKETWPLTWRAAGAFLASYLVLTAVFTGLGKLLKGPLDGTVVVRTDHRVAQWFVDRRTPTRNTLSTIGSQLSETLPKIVLTTLVAGALLFVWHRWFESLVIALSLILEASVFITVTTLVGRPRPDVPHLEHSPVDSSFFSGHVAAAVVYGAGAVVIAWHTRSQWWPALAGLLTTAVAICVAVARMYRGMHFLTDVIAGAMLGLCSVTLATIILARTPQGREVLGRRSAPAPVAEEVS